MEKEFHFTISADVKAMSEEEAREYLRAHLATIWDITGFTINQ